MATFEKIDRTEIVDYLDITPSSTPTWAVVGQGITDMSTDYSANTTTEKFIINKNATTTVDGYEVSTGAEQSCYKGDEEFEYVDNLRHTLAVGAKAESHHLSVDKYSYTEADDGTVQYRANMFDCSIEVSSRGGDTAKINYTIHDNGDPTEGTVTYTNGVPTFTASV